MSALSTLRLARMHGERNPESMQHLQHNAEFTTALQRVAMVGMAEPDLFA